MRERGRWIEGPKEEAPGGGKCSIDREADKGDERGNEES